MKTKHLLLIATLLAALPFHAIPAATSLDSESPGLNNPHPQKCGVTLKLVDMMRNADDDQNKQSHFDAQDPEHEVLDWEHVPSPADENDLVECTITGNSGPAGGELDLLEIQGAFRYHYILWEDPYKTAQMEERYWLISPNVDFKIVFYLEGFVCSDQKEDVKMKAVLWCPAVTVGSVNYAETEVEHIDAATVWEADLDIDSRNLAGLEFPEWGVDTEDDKIEHCEEETQPGKYIVTGINKDSDGDGTPDFADGLGLAPALKTQGTDSGTCGEDSKLIPIRVELREPIVLEKASVEFAYKEEETENIPRLGEGFTQSGSGEPNDPWIYKLTNPGMRLWAVNAPYRVADKQTGEDVTEGNTKRKFIPVGKPSPWKVLTSLAESDGPRAVIIYVEYVEDSGTVDGGKTIAGAKKEISVIEQSESGGLAKDLVQVTLVPVEVQIAKPDSWDELPEKQVVLFDENTRIKIKVGTKLDSIEEVKRICRMDSLKIHTNGTRPEGSDFAIEAGKFSLVSGTLGSGVELHTAFSRQELKDKGLLPNQEQDGVREIAWYDYVDETGGGSLADSWAFEAGCVPEIPWKDLRGRGFRDGSLETNQGRPLHSTLWQSGGAQIMKAQASGAISKTRQLSDQADVFYYSGHGSYMDGSVWIDTNTGMYPESSKWDKDMEVAILNACSVLGIKSGTYRYGIFKESDREKYDAHYADTDPSPGERWESLAPNIKLGYCFSAPLDQTGIPAKTMARYQALVENGMDPVGSWGQANLDVTNHFHSNACAIDTQNIPHEYWYFADEEYQEFNIWAEAWINRVRPKWTKVIKTDSGW